jgi:hypothetical protein
MRQSILTAVAGSSANGRRVLSRAGITGVALFMGVMFMSVMAAHAQSRSAVAATKTSNSTRGMRRMRSQVMDEKPRFKNLFATSSDYFAFFAVKSDSLNRKDRKGLAKGAKECMAERN